MALVLFDVSSLIYRAFYTLNPEKFARPSDGLANNAVYGVASMTLSLIKKFQEEFHNIHPVACLDSPTCNKYRKNISKEYKLNRPKCPTHLSHQFDWITELYVSLGIAVVKADGFEADDIIASYAHQCKLQYEQIVMVSPDKDLCQLIGDGVLMYNTRTKSLWNAAEVIEKFDVHPDNFVLYQSIIGDKVDNVNGIRGIGPKTAVSIIKACNGNLNEPYVHTKKHVIDKNLDTIETNKKLVSMVCTLDVCKRVKRFEFVECRDTFLQFIDKMEISSPTLKKYIS